MGKTKHLYELEDQIFQTLEGLYQAFEYKKKDNYRLALGTLELLNMEYKVLTGVYFIEENRILDYYSKMWEI